MLKAVGIMAVSVCAIAVLITSQTDGPIVSAPQDRDEELVEEKPKAAVKKPVAQKQPETSDDSYYSDEDVNFTFGEPMMTGEPIDYENVDDDYAEQKPAKARKKEPTETVVGMPGNKPKKAKFSDEPAKVVM